MAKIKNFTLSGDALQLTAMIDRSGEPCFMLCFNPKSDPEDKLFTYDELLELVEAMRNDLGDWDMLYTLEEHDHKRFSSYQINKFEETWRKEKSDGVPVQDLAEE
jgi:hypothetical protein